MVSDEQSSPWLPVNPPHEPEDASAEPTQEPEPTSAPAPAAPWVTQDWSGQSPAAPTSTPPVTPSAPPSKGQIPRVPHPDDPFTEQPTMSQFAAPSTPAVEPWAPATPAASVAPAAPASFENAPESEPEPAPEPEPEPASEPAPAPEPEPEPEPEPAPPLAAPRSPYLTGELPRATEAPARPSLFQPPAATPPAATPPAVESTAATSVDTPTDPAPVESQLTPARPVVPGTGSIPLVSAAFAPPTPDALPTPDAPPTPAAVEAPYAHVTPAWETRVPQPIEIDDDDADVVPPVEPPAPEEILPTVDAEPATPQSAWAWDAAPQPESPTVDPVRDLGTSAVAAASLQAAGAPTPASDGSAPDVDSVPDLDAVPDFGSDEPFVPRFEPPAEAAFAPPAAAVPTPAPSPSVSFQPPAPRPIDPLSQLEVPTSDEPAYTPTLATDDDADVADAVMDDLNAARGSGPATPLEGWPYRNEEPTPPDNPYASRPSQTIENNDVLDAPFTPLAPAHFDDILAENPFAAAAPLTDDPGARPWASVLGQSQREESANPPDVTPASGAETFQPSAAPAADGANEAAVDPAPDEPATEVIEPMPSVERRPAPYSPLMTTLQPGATAAPEPRAPDDEDGPDAGFAGAPVVSPIDSKPGGKDGMGRSRLILIIVAAALVAGVIGVLVYRTYLLPEPVTMPTPTVTAEPRVPEGEPIAIEEEASEFLSAMPLQVGADVLMAYEVLDPVGDQSLPARAAEHLKLSYGSGVGEPVYTVHAYQHYSVDDAQAAYDAYAAGAPDVADVTVDGDVVGQRAFQAASARGQVVWRNGTAVFVVTGPASDLVHFYERFGV